MNKKIMLLLVFFSLPSWANSSFGTKTISRLIIHDSGHLIVNFNGVDTHSETCDSKSTYVVPNDNPHFDHIYSGLLAAMHSGSNVAGWVNGCVSWWGKSKARITRVDFYPLSK